jgi:hypothetical protein
LAGAQEGAEEEEGMMRVRLVWQATFRPVVGMEGWTLYRVEYWDAEGEAAEGSLWLPPSAEVDGVEAIEATLNAVLAKEQETGHDTEGAV